MIEMWAIKRPDGGLRQWPIEKTAWQARFQMEGFMAKRWPVLKCEGYAVVKVTIKEVNPAPSDN